MQKQSRTLSNNQQGMSVEAQGKALLKATKDGNLATVIVLLQVSHP